jgi:PAS domain S-box-containing protein
MLPLETDKVEPQNGARIAELEAELARLQRALEAGGIGIYDWDLHNADIRWSDGMGRLVGRPDGPGVQGRQIFDLIHPEDRERAEAAVEKAMEEDEPIEVTFRVLGKDGSIRWIASRGRAERDESGQAVRIIGINYDVTEPYRAEQDLRESQRRLHAMMENLPGVIFYQVLTSPDMSEREYLYISPNAVKVLGVSPEHLASAPGEMMGQVEYADLAEVLAKERAAADALDILDLQIDGTRRDGKVVRTRVITRPRPGPGGKLIWDGVLIDITERVEAQEALKESEERFRAMADNLPILCWWADKSGYIYWYNQRWYEYTGTTSEQMAGWGWRDVHQPAMLPAVMQRWTASISSGEPFEMVFPLKATDGSFRPFLTRAMPLRDESGEVVRWFGTNTDIAEQQAIEAALRESEERFRAMADSAPVPVWVSGERGIEFVNQVFCEFSGLQAKDLLEDQWTALIHGDDLPSAMAMRDRARERAEPYKFEARFRRKDGEWRWLQVSLRPRAEGEGKLIGYVGVATDMTDVRSTEEALREQGRTLETLNRIGASLAAELNLDKLIQMAVDAGVELTGAEFGAFCHKAEKADGPFELSTLCGIGGHELFFDSTAATEILQDAQSAKGLIRSDDITEHDRYGPAAARIARIGGRQPVRSFMAVRVVSSSGAVIGALILGHSEVGRFSDRHEHLMRGMAAQAAVAMDNARLYRSAEREIASRMKAEQEARLLNETLEQRVEEEVERRSEAEEALRQVQKMETLGQLTGGVAHDFNNLLQIISGNIELIRRGLPEDSARLRRAADNAGRGAERAAVLTQRLLAFSRRQPLAPKPIDLKRLVTGMSELLHRTIGEAIEVETVLAPGLWNVEADPHQLENSILNLAVNARDAMPEGGKLTIETCNTHLDCAYAEANPGAAEGQYVCISVSDSGAGMDEATLAKAFEPFFTTKEVGKGTGLGLSMVYGFVKQSGGHIKIYSEPAEGTTVRIYLPRIHAESAPAEAAVRALELEAGQDETILVCEDDDDVRAFTVEVLRELGYRVLEAHDGPSALRLLERPEGKVDLLFTDVILPSGMTGAVLAERARMLRPDLKVLFTTGYARNAIVHQGRLDPGVELITKPFSHADLAARVRRMLDGLI